MIDGGASLDPNIARYILDRLKATPAQSKPQRSLSDREREILCLLSEGLLKKEIADKLQIGVTTVAYHVRHIYEKLNVKKRREAVEKAEALGVLPHRGFLRSVHSLLP